MDSEDEIEVAPPSTGGAAEVAPQGTGGADAAALPSSTSSGGDLATTIVGKCLSEGTKRSYSGAIKKFTKYVEERYPSCVVDGQLVLPLAHPKRDEMNSKTHRCFSGADIILEFLEQETQRDPEKTKAKKKKGADGEAEPDELSSHMSASHLGMCTSAIVHLFKSRGVELDDYTSHQMSAFLSGYKRSVAEWKQLGEMALTHPVSSSPLSQQEDAVQAATTPRVEAGPSLNATSKLQAAGIPPHIAIANELRQLKEDFAAQAKQRAKDLDTLVQEIRALPWASAAALLDRAHVDGARPVSRADLEELAHRLEGSLEALIRDRFAQAPAAGAAGAAGAATTATAAITATTATAATAAPSAAAPPAEGPAPWPTYTWGGMTRLVPESFEFPKNSMSCSQMWYFWHFGYTHPDPHNAYRVAPFRLLKGVHFDRSKPAFKTLKGTLSKAGKVMEVLRNTAVKLKTVPSLAELDSLGDIPSRAVFRSAFDHMCRAELAGPGGMTAEKVESLGQLSFQRIYELLGAARKRKAGEAEAEAEEE